MNSNFKLLHNISELEGTCYIEFLPGKYTGKCWNESSIYINEETFLIFEDLFKEVLINYDHYSFNEMPASKVRLLKVKLHQRISILKNLQNNLLNGETLSLQINELFTQKFKSNQIEIIQMLENFYDWLKKIETQNIPLSILGI
ncbi:MAG: hypothetical protein SH817_15195 [Leptospira sp.]|nr:hypothetical protein [Leptospira sp.]